MEAESKGQWLSLLGGGALAVYGLSRRSWGGMALALLGANLAYWSRKAGRRERPRIGGSRFQGGWLSTSEGVHVEESVTINRSPDELYRYWRQLENLPRIMRHLESVTELDNCRSHWIAKGPAGARVEWDAEIINEDENAMIAWRSLPGADVSNAGSVHFRPALGGRGTEVKVILRYEPPGGEVAAMIARLFRRDPETEIKEDLRQFKQLMEAGEVARTTSYQQEPWAQTELRH